MLYKVTPALAPPARRPSAAGPPRPKKRRASAVYDADGHEVLITLMCLKCRQVRPLAQFGLRKMPDGAIRNQPWCRSCRGAATPKKRPEAEPAPSVPALVAAEPVVPEPASSVPALGAAEPVAPEPEPVTPALAGPPISRGDDP